MTKITGIFITVFNNFIKLIGKALELIFFLLPDSPFKNIDNSPIVEFLGYLNYLIPIPEILGILTLWCSAIGVFYIVQIALRWIKAID